jgi:hypothetical protein
LRDRYFDLAEVSRYISHFVSAVDNFKDLNPIVGELAGEQQQYLDRFSVSLSQAESSRSDVSMAGRAERSSKAQARDRLRKLYDQLVALEHDYTFDLKRFFETGRKQDVGTSVARLQRTLARCIDGLKQYPDLPNAATWRAELEELQGQFSTASSDRSAKDSGKRTDSQVLTAARLEWAEKYAATKFILRGLLKRVGREAEWKGLFLDLQTSGSSGGGSSASGG